jgi:RNA polymerase sigma factor (sigma-70 family)
MSDTTAPAPIAARTDPPSPADDLPMGQVSWTVLVEAARRGEAAAWETLVARTERLLRHVVTGYRLPADDASDVVQTTWLRLLENIDRIRDPEHLTGWLTTTAARAALAASRRRRREAPLDGIDVADVGADVADHVEARLQALRLRGVVATLPPRERSLLEMLLLPEEPSYREISRRLGMPIGSIGPVRQRAMSRLRGILAEPRAVGAA